MGIELQNLYAALFTRVVYIGETSPAGEVDYEGYERVLFAADNKTNLEQINFPEAKADCRDSEGNMIPVMCISAIDCRGLVVGVMEL